MMAHGCTYCTDDFHCEKFTDEKHTSWCYGKDYPCKDRRISNADLIRGYTDEELARWLSKTDPECDPPDWWLRWLKQEADNAGND